MNVQTTFYVFGSI